MMICLIGLAVSCPHLLLSVRWLPLGCVPRIPVVPVAPRAPELDGTEVDCPGLGAGVGPVSLGIRLAFVSVVAGVPALDGSDGLAGVTGRCRRR
jgi:hypothetical protein